MTSPRLEAPTPGARVLGAVVVASSIAALPQVTGATALAVLACAIATALMARPNLRLLSLRLGVALGVVGALTLPFLLSGDLERFTRMGLRALGAAVVALTFTSDLSGVELARALRTLRAPAALIEVIEGLASQIDTLNVTARRILLARKLRGARGLKGAASIIPELLVRSAERAERLGLARRLRGYDCPRRPKGLQRQDVWPLLIAASTAVFLHASAWWG